MKHRFLIKASFVIFALIGGAAIAPGAGAQWYVSGNVGAALLDDADTTDTLGAASATFESSFDAGVGITGAVGHSFAAFRIEGEISYRQNDLDEAEVSSITVGGTTIGVVGTLALEGDISALGFMANGWYDFDTGSKWVPSVGAGIGVVNLSLDIESVGGAATVFDESDTVFAFQAAAEIGYQVMPSTIVGVSYRFLGTSDPDFEAGGETIESEYLSHNIMVGVRHKF